MIYIYIMINYTLDVSLFEKRGFSSILAYWRETVMEKMIVEISWLHSECFEDLFLRVALRFHFLFS